MPETGNVIKLESTSAVIMFEGGKSCKGCVAARTGLCRAGGSSMFITVQNPIFAKVWDEVIIGIDKNTQLLGYLLANLILLFAPVGGSVSGNIMGLPLAIPALDVLTPFILLALTATFSFWKLRALGRSHPMEVRKIVSMGEFSEFERQRKNIII